MPEYTALGGVSQADLAAAMAANLAAMQASIPSVPVPASTAPPGVGVSGAPGSQASYARADHTHASSVQRARIPVTAAQVTWNYTNPYSVVPIVTCTVENPANATQPYVAVLVGTPTLTSATFAVYKAQPTTLGATLTALLGAIINPFASVPSGVNLNCWAALPTP